MPDRHRSSLRRRIEDNGRQVIAGLAAAGIILLVIAISAATLNLGNITEDTDRVEESLELKASLNRLSTYNEQIENGRRGFLIQPDPAFASVIRQATSRFDEEYRHFQRLAEGDPAEPRLLERIAELQARRLELIDELFADPQAARARNVRPDLPLSGSGDQPAETDEGPSSVPSPGPAVDAFGDEIGPNALRDPAALSVADQTDFDADPGVLILREIRGIIEELAQQKQAQLAVRNRNQLDSLLNFYMVGGIALLLLLALMGAAIVLVMRYNRDLTRAQQGLRAANEGLESAVAARTAELTRANEEIQRFAYIVSHDLRSPLVNVLGFTAELEQARGVLRNHLEALYEANPDLRDQEAWLAVDEDLPEAVDFIRTSTEKMDRLINSILQLSRQGRRNLAPEVLDMDELVEGVVATLHQRAEDAGATIVANPIPAIESDRIAIEQILSNLIENALKYLSPSRPGEIRIEGARSQSGVCIDVVDNGRGIAPEDHQRIFDLFRRAGQQDQAGEGIGLANVRALAYRLGGTIEVESELDRGSRFRLCLPDKLVATERLG